VPRSKIRYPAQPVYRFSVLSVVSAAGFVLMKMGFPAIEAMTIALIAAAGAVEVACWLTAPDAAFGIRIKVLVLILILVLRLLALGHPVAPVLLGVIGGCWCAAWIGKRLTDMCYRLPRVRVVF
jgi:hypothetical protein